MHTIFLIHGMGEFSPGWSSGIQSDIKTYYDPQKYRFLSPFPFNSIFRFVEVTYDNFFVEYLKEARKQANQLDKWDKIGPHLPHGTLPILQQIVDAAATAPANNFLVNYLGDVAFYIATDVSELINNSLIGQFNTGLGQNFDPASDRWSIIAHSLGTRVTTEFLQAGFTTFPSLRSFGKARVLMQVANVSRLLQDLSLTNAGDVYHNAVYPSLDASNGVCTHFINATHRLDPIAYVDEFDPPQSFGDGNVFLNDLYHSVMLSAADITSKDIHALRHYMRHPMVHTTLFRYLLPGDGSQGPTDAELKAAMASYMEETIGANITNTWRKALANLKKDPFHTIEEIFALWQKYGQLAHL